MVSSSDSASPASRQRLAIRVDPIAQLLDFAPGREDAARLDLGAAGHQMRPAEDIALQRRDDGAWVCRENVDRLVEALGHVRFGR